MDILPLVLKVFFIATWTQIFKQNPKITSWRKLQKLFIICKKKKEKKEKPYFQILSPKLLMLPSANDENKKLILQNTAVHVSPSLSPIVQEVIMQCTAPLNVLYMFYSCFFFVVYVTSCITLHVPSSAWGIMVYFVTLYNADITSFCSFSCRPHTEEC